MREAYRTAKEQQLRLWCFAKGIPLFLQFPRASPCLCRAIWSSRGYHTCSFTGIPPLAPGTHTARWTHQVCAQGFWFSERLLIMALLDSCYRQIFASLAKGNRGCPSTTLCSGHTLRIRLKSSLSTLKKWQLSSLKTIEAALGASLTSANLPKSSPSCRVQTTPWRGWEIQWRQFPKYSRSPPTADQEPHFPSDTGSYMGYTQGCQGELHN